MGEWYHAMLGSYYSSLLVVVHRLEDILCLSKVLQSVKVGKFLFSNQLEKAKNN